MRRHPTIISHGRRRLWWAPWIVICQCGLEEYPCAALRMLDLQRRMRQDSVRESERQRNARRTQASRWNAATALFPSGTSRKAEMEHRLNGPLLTPGQAHRSRNRRRQP